MSKKEHKLYLCVHAPCVFRTDKRKAIYTHLVRTHNERKEDYECEYCSSMFELDSEIERHLHVHHPTQPFTYTCVSRIEKVINNCAKLGTDSKHPQPSIKSADGEISVISRSSDEKKNTTKAENSSPISKPPYLKPNISMRTRASVNESLNNIAKQPKFASPDGQTIHESRHLRKDTIHEDDGTIDGRYGENTDEEMEEVEIDTDEESPTYISKPSGLKIKLSLKKSTADDLREVSSERSSSPPLLEASAEDEMNSSEIPDETPPDIVRSLPVCGTAQVRVKDSKYYDKLEVYHHTDEFGRRCCPFCDYKTSKNTIRVHLSGIHKIHFVKCSLCDYKAAFPHQITQHGIKFHKTTNLNVIQLSKESRDKIIAQLKKPDGVTSPAISTQNDTVTEPVNKTADAMGTRHEAIDDEDFNSDESYPTSADENESSAMHADDRSFKPPKCQTSKTDYYSIRVEKGVYMYSCNLCTFQTPVRATIYTHKYRHEEKSYRCGYCDFTSAPRSNVVHHCRVKHKNCPINVVENDLPDDAIDLDHEEASVTEVEGNKNNAVKTEPGETFSGPNAYMISKTGSAEANITTDQPTALAQEKSHQTIIKVPQFKRSITSDSYETSGSSEIKRPMLESDVPGVEYKLSLNKLYRINPTGSPKFMCALCSYACDTHPKMKHHLYRHRPQKYKCPYCDHRKYPRSYVVRHVRDTHRNKPVRVIDLSKGNEPEDIPEYMNDGVADDTFEDTVENIDAEGGVDESQPINHTPVKQEVDADTIPAGKSDVTANASSSDLNTEQNEEVNALKNFAQKLNLRSVLTTDLNDDIFMQSSDVSPNFSDAVYTSSPLIESFINGNYQNPNTPKGNTKNFEKKKSLKDYRVNYGQGPRYICNKCGYGTENYKTIHNHMYRHESQRYQCPYCGYRRSPRSFVENHIREVHKGHPVIVTELNVDQEMSDTPIGSPRQCVTQKRKDPPQDMATLALTLPTKVPKNEDVPAKTPAKWPAPKPVSQINLVQSGLPATGKLMANAGENNPALILQASTPIVLSTLTNEQLSDAKINSPAVTSSVVPMSSAAVSSARFIERNRTTFKTMYKCVFDPETCNHISKDKSKMKQHLFMHVEYKPWSCDFCDMTASQSSHIKTHVRTEHPGVADTSFKYKRHNYLEKHIESFLTKGLFTVPVNEYRAIMDMKGNTKSSKQPTFERDEEGNLLCPYCSYRTKSGGMTDHVKMKHMQPRFKCHWCDYRAFYRSEVRKHHRKEKSHVNLEFKTKELDLVQLMEGYKERNGDSFGEVSTDSSSLDPSHFFGEEDDEDDVDDDGDRGSECSSSEGSSIGDYHQGYVEYTTEQLTELCTNKQTNEQMDIDNEKDAEIEMDATNKQALLESLNTEVGPDGSMIIVQKPNSETQVVKEKSEKESRFKCGYCSFSAGLRVKVKMHCSKKHAGKVLKIVDPSAKSEPSVLQENLDANDWKGTKFEQDLRKAGVSKLNLASLFPNSKRFQKSNACTNDINEKQNDEKDVAEFKKPLEPVSKGKMNERKAERSSVSNRADNVAKLSDHTEENSDETPESDKNSPLDSTILITDVKTLKPEAADHSMNGVASLDDTSKISSEDAGQGIGENKTKVEKLMTAFPNYTEVILEDEANDDRPKESETELEDNDSLIEQGIERGKSDDETVQSNESDRDVIKHKEGDCERIEGETLNNDSNRQQTKFLNTTGEHEMESEIEKEGKTNGAAILCEKHCESDQKEHSSGKLHDIPDGSKTEGSSLVNGHRFATDRTSQVCDDMKSIEVDCKAISTELADDTDITSKINIFKPDGTCEGVVGKKLKHEESEMDTNLIKTSTVMDLPTSNDTTCALKDICDES